MTTNEIYQFFQFLANIAQAGSITPDQFNLTLKNAELAIFNRYYGQAKQYLRGEDIPQVGYEQTQLALDALKPFKKKSFINQDQQTGQASYPSDYLHATAFSMITGAGTEKPVNIVADDKWAYRTSSALLVAKENPAANLQASYVQFWPFLGKYYIWYLRYPVPAVWGYTVVGGRPVYNAGSTAQSEIPAWLHEELVYAMCEDAGVNIAREDLVAYAKDMKFES